MGLKSKKHLPSGFSQHNELPIRLVTPDFGHLPQSEAEKYNDFIRLPYYYFLFIIEGSGTHRVDMERFELKKHELLFATPHQMLEFSHAAHSSDYYKLGFDEHCMSRLPRQYAFLHNPKGQQRISFSPKAAARLKDIFLILLDLLQTPDSEPELLLAYLNSLLSEINASYFAPGEKPADVRHSTFTDFKLFVEDNLTGHPTISKIAETLAVSTDSLYYVVKQHTGLSPKEFINERMISEARRRLYYGQRSSVKELAYDLGFNDPDYFSRLFKKVTGKTVASFFKDLS